MFTGLIRTQGTIRRVDQRGDCMVTIATPDPFAMDVGDSIAVNGICLTAIKVNDNEFKVSLSVETLNRTTAKEWEVGTVVNIEPSLSVGDAMGGHFVAGHVDGLVHVVAYEKVGDSAMFEFEVPPHLSRFLASKGSVTLDGVSLTVNEVRDRKRPDGSPMTTFTVNIIPHTIKTTSFSRLRVGDPVNIEVDMLARYVARLTEKKPA